MNSSSSSRVGFLIQQESQGEWAIVELAAAMGFDNMTWRSHRDWLSESERYGFGGSCMCFIEFSVCKNAMESVVNVEKGQSEDHSARYAA